MLASTKKMKAMGYMALMCPIVVNYFYLGSCDSAIGVIRTQAVRTIQDQLFLEVETKM